MTTVAREMGDARETGNERENQHGCGLQFQRVASSWVKCYFYAKQSMERLPLVFLVSCHVFYVVFLYLNARIMPVAGCKTHKMWDQYVD